MLLHKKVLELIEFQARRLACVAQLLKVADVTWFTSEIRLITSATTQCRKVLLGRTILRNAGFLPLV